MIFVIYTLHYINLIGEMLAHLIRERRTLGCCESPYLCLLYQTLRHMFMVCCLKHVLTHNAMPPQSLIIYLPRQSKTSFN